MRNIAMNIKIGKAENTHTSELISSSFKANFKEVVSNRAPMDDHFILIRTHQHRIALNDTRYGFNRQDSRESTSRIFIRQDSRDSRESTTRFIRQDSKDSRDSYRCCDVEICRCRVCLIQQRNQPITRTCCCEKGEIRLQRSFDEDYISLKIDEECMSDEEQRRARRKRRRKRRRRIRRQLALEAMRGAASLPPRQPADDKVKVLDNDELPPKARWTIVATASLLLFLCLFLVGVTLRMAPLIDDIVRMENEQLINSYTKDAAKLNLTLGHPSVQILDIT